MSQTQTFKILILPPDIEELYCKGYISIKGYTPSTQEKHGMYQEYTQAEWDATDVDAEVGKLLISFGEYILNKTKD